MVQLSETITLEELSLHYDNKAARELLVNIIVDESSQTNMKINEQLKPNAISGGGGGGGYGKFEKICLKTANKSFMFMMYTPAYHGTCSSIKFTDYVSSSMHYSKEDINLDSCVHTCHPFLCPYYMANVKVKQLTDRWIKSNATSPLLPSVKILVQMYEDSEEHCEAYTYTEEDWTVRLTKSLNVHPLFASRDEGSSATCVSSFRWGETSKLDEFRQEHFGIKRKITGKYLFQGLPDIYLMNKKVQIIQCSAGDDGGDDALVPGQGGVDATSTALQQHPTGATPTPTALDPWPKVVIAEAAQGHLVVCNYPYNKMGELLANMHCAHNDHILQDFMRNDFTIKPFDITGIFLHKGSGYSKFAMKLKPKQQHSINFTAFEYHIEHSIAPAQLLDGQLLCAVLKKYAGVDLHNIVALPSCQNDQ